MLEPQEIHMAGTATRFQGLMTKMSQGSEEAAWELVEIYTPHILRSVRANLPKAIRPKFDSQDFVQAVWTSILVKRVRLDQFHSPEQFIGYVAAMARNKVIDMQRHYLQTKSYGIRSEIPLPSHENNGTAGPHFRLARTGKASTGQRVPSSKEPTPSQVAVVRETWRSIVCQKSERDQQIVSLRVAGHTYTAIAQQLSIGEKTVRRVLHRILSDFQT